MSTSNSNLNSFVITSITVQVSLVPGQMFGIGCDLSGRVYVFPVQSVQQPVEYSTTTTTTAVTNTAPSGAVSNAAAVASSDEEEDEIPEAERQVVQVLIDEQEAMEQIHEFVENLDNEGGLQEDDIFIALEDLAENVVLPLSALWDRQVPLHKKVEAMKKQREEDRKNKVKKTQEQERVSKREFFGAFDEMIAIQREYLATLSKLGPAIEHVQDLDPEFDIDKFIHELEPRNPGFAKVSNYMKLCNDVAEKFKQNVANDDKMRARASTIHNHTVSDYVAAQLGAESASNIVTTTSRSYANVVGCGGGNN